jgi:glycosyltransferase involved in cell wall biosynthesis
LNSVVPLSVVIPAHDEETVLGRCLDAVLTGARPGEIDVVVVCNGCSDRTADVARSYGGRVRVVETPVPSKSNALNLGDEAARGFPRFYVDADVVLTLDGIRKIAARLADGGAPAAAPAMNVDLSGASWPVRGFYAVWSRLPYTREGMIGVGVYALSESGRRRFERFPDVIADDGYVRALFDASERARVDEAPVRVVAPATLADLIRVKTRSRLGGFELAQRFPELMARERRKKDYFGAASVVAFRPWLWPHAAAYLWVNFAARRRARAQLAQRGPFVWERDRSSRRPASSAGVPPSR